MDSKPCDHENAYLRSLPGTLYCQDCGKLLESEGADVGDTDRLTEAELAEVAEARAWIDEAERKAPANLGDTLYMLIKPDHVRKLLAEVRQRRADAEKARIEQWGRTCAWVKFEDVDDAALLERVRAWVKEHETRPVNGWADDDTVTIYDSAESPSDRKAAAGITPVYDGCCDWCSSPATHDLYAGHGRDWCMTENKPVQRTYGTVDHARKRSAGPSLQPCGCYLTRPHEHYTQTSDGSAPFLDPLEAA